MRVNAEGRVVDSGRKPRPYEDEHARYLFLIEGKILTTKRFRCGYDIQPALLRLFLCVRCPKAIVARCGRTFVPIRLHRGTVGCCQLFCESTDTRADLCTLLCVHAARRPLDECLLGNHVPRIPRRNMRDAHNTRRERVKIARDDRLHGLDERRRKDNRIDAGLGMCGMRPRTVKAENKAIHRRHHRSLRDADRTDLQEWRGVQAENRCNVLQRTCLDEHLRAARRLLCRLEEDAHAPRELRLMLLEQERRAKYRRDMEVVPAGVHPSSMLRAVRQIRLLLDRQGIDIGAQRNERLPLPDLRDQSRLERQIQNADPRTLQGGANPLRRLDLLIGELGMTMEPLKFLYDERVYILNFCHDILPLNSYIYDML